MQPATAPVWEPSPSASAAVAMASQQHRSSLLLGLVGVMLYVGLMVVGFYLGVCWVQNAINELTLAVKELQHEVHAILKAAG